MVIYEIWYISISVMFAALEQKKTPLIYHFNVLSFGGLFWYILILWDGKKLVLPSSVILISKTLLGWTRLNYRLNHCGMNSCRKNNIYPTEESAKITSI